MAVEAGQVTGARSIRTVDRTASVAVLDIISLAFARDPIARFWWPAAHDYLYWWPRFAAALNGRGFDHGSVDLIDGCAAAMWLPPGIETDPADMAAVDADPGPTHADPALEQSFDFDAETVSERLRTEMARFHPDEPHWYLGVIGTDPNRQGQGHAARLMEHRLAIIDQAGDLAYLEASNPGLVPFYQRFGFEQIGVIDANPVPPLFAMVRRRG